MDLRAELKAAISRACDVPVDAIHDTSTVDDIGFDSLASAEVLTELEITLDAELPVDALRRLVKARTFGEVAELLEQELTPTSPVPE